MKKKKDIPVTNITNSIQEPQNAIAIIPARGGSKGITDKNVRTVGGRMLVDWSIRQARNAGLDLIVSTDSKDYKQKIDAMYPKENYCPFIRPEKLARDDTPTVNVIIHALDWIQDNLHEKYNTFVLLEPTSPLRKTADITLSLAMLRQGAKAVVSVCADHRAHPAISFRMNRGYLQPNMDMPHLRRQALEPFYHLSGAIYAADIAFYRQHQTFITTETKGHIVERWQDHEIDEPDDILVIETFIKRVI